MPRASRKSELLDAAGRLVQARGVQALTLDAVAQATNSSKGGVLYHFPTKEALITALIERLVVRFESRFSRSGNFVEGFVTACIEVDAHADEMAAGLAVAIATDPSMLEPLRSAYVRWMRRIQTEVKDPLDGWLIRLALDGLWFSDLFGLPVPSTAQRKRLASRLTQIAKSNI